MQSAYNPTEIAKIGATLDAFFEQMGGEASVTRGSNSNLIIPISSSAKLKEFENTVEELVEIHPSRFFLVQFDSAQKEPSAAVSARCKLLGKGEHLCAELIRLSLSDASAAVLPSVLQANLVTGSVSELFLLDPEIGMATLQKILALVDTVFFDSHLFERNLFGVNGVGSLLLSRPLQLVDLRWIALVAWREQIKEVFSRQRVLEYLPKLRAITIAGAGTADGSWGSDIWLLLGWLRNSLGLSAISKNKSGFLFGHAQEGRIECRVEPNADKDCTGIARILFEFGASSDCVCLSRQGARLESKLSLSGEEARYYAPFEDQGSLDLLKRFFLIGVSTQNYRPALQGAANLFSMA